MKVAIKFSRVETYFRENPGALFILFFQVLLLTCAFLVMGGASALAEEIAVYAYFTLVIGVVLQFFSYLFYSKERSKVNHRPMVEGDVVARKVEAPEDQALSVVIPAYNERGTIAGSIKRLQSDLRRLNLDYEIIVVDDGSTDNTSELVKEMANYNEGKLRFIHMDRNMGKGEAFRRGYEESRGSYVLLKDADLETPQNLLADYLKYVRGADVVVASKRHPESEVSYGFCRSFLSRGFNQLVNVLFNLRLDDTQCGFKLFRREVLDTVMPILTLKKYAFDVELLVCVRNRGFKVVSAPIVLRNLRERTMKMRAIFRMGIDLLAVFYRLHLTNTYD